MGLFVITAGHSEVDPGAVHNGRKEADIARELRNIVMFKLNRLGHFCDSDGEGNTNKSLNEAIALIKRRQPLAAVEIHLNASTNPTAGGVETIGLPKDRKLAQSISKAISEVMGIKVRGDSGYIDQTKSARGKLGYVNAGGLIVETFFISNPSELATYDAKKWLIADAIATTLDKYAKRPI